jgi:hypothetical protein
MNQHFVPKAYLKNFGTRKGKNFVVNVFDKHENRFFETNIKRICSEINLYTLEEGNSVAKDLFAIEKIYANGIEPLYVEVYKLLTNNRIRFISGKQRTEILIAIFQFYVRNPAFLRDHLAFHTAKMQELYQEAQKNGEKGFSYFGDDFSFREWTFEALCNHLRIKILTEYKESHVMGIGELSEYHFKAKFEINIARGDAEFITCDNPLVFNDIISNNKSPLIKSNEFTIALDKKFALRIYHDNTKDSNQIYRAELPNLSVTMINNEIQQKASRFVIGPQSTIRQDLLNTSKYLDNTDLEPKIDMMRQVLKLFSENPKHKSGLDIIHYYLQKYETEGILSDQDQYDCVSKLNEIKKSVISQKIR